MAYNEAAGLLGFVSPESREVYEVFFARQGQQAAEARLQAEQVVQQMRDEIASSFEGVVPLDEIGCRFALSGESFRDTPPPSVRVESSGAGLTVDAAELQGRLYIAIDHPVEEQSGFMIRYRFEMPERPTSGNRFVGYRSENGRTAGLGITLNGTETGGLQELYVLRQDGKIGGYAGDQLVVSGASIHPNQEPVYYCFVIDSQVKLTIEEVRVVRLDEAAIKE